MSVLFGPNREPLTGMTKPGHRCRIEVVDSRAFMGACLLWRWVRATCIHPDTWEGLMRAKWVALAMEQKQYEFEEVDPYGFDRTGRK